MDAVHLAKGPYLTDLSSTGVEVRFELDGDAPASVQVTRGASDGGGWAHRFGDSTVKAMHSVRLTGLDPSVVYTYDVRVGGASLGAGRFVTAPAPDSASPVTFLVYGDDRTDPVAHAAVVRAMLAIPSDFLVNTGDMVEDGGRAADWQTFFDVEADLLRGRPLFVAIGNHELYDDSAGANFGRYFGFTDLDGTTRPYGTVRVGAARFFFLNGMHDWDGGEERQWLEGALRRADVEGGLRYRVAVVHHGPASSGPHGPNPKLVDAHVPELLVAHHVDVLFAGHDHIYDRGEVSGLKYVVSGGGGAPPYPIAALGASSQKAESTYHFVEVTTESDGIRTVVHRGDGSIVERCAIRSARPWDCTQGSPPVRGPEPAAAAVRFEAGLPGSPGGAPSSEAKQGSGHGRCGCTAPGAPSASGLAGPASVAFFLAFFRRRGRRCS